MLKNTVFDDTMYQLNKIIRITTEGLSLELSMDIFFEKTVNDISFIATSLQCLFIKLKNFSHLPEYIQMMQNLYSCESDYLLLLETFAAKTIEKQPAALVCTQDISVYYKQHSTIRDQIGTLIKESDDNPDAYQVVSKNELSQLLCV